MPLIRRERAGEAVSKRGFDGGMQEKTPCIGIIAGNGRLPALVARAARDRGYRTVAVGVTGEIDSDLPGNVDRYRRAHVGQWAQVVEELQEMGAEQVVLLGKVPKASLFDGQAFDARFQSLIGRLKRRNDDAILQAIVDDLETEGFAVTEQARLLPDLFPGAGVLGVHQPSPREWADIAFGFETAKAVAGLDIGQTVVVKDGVVLAVEAIEGTDQAVLRGGRLAVTGCTVVKVSKPQQDPRFDVPTVGLQTLDALCAVKGRVVAFEAGATFLVERSALLRKADEAGVAVVSYEPNIGE